MRLYFTPRTRATRPRWVLEEIGAAYELVPVDLEARENRAPDYLALHPLAQVPVLVDGDLVLIESAAICMYLADRFPEAGLAPPPGSPLRARYYQWMFYCPATLEPPIQQHMQHTTRLPEAERVPLLAERARARWREVAAPLRILLSAGPCMLGARFSALDVIVASNLNWARRVGLLDDDPVLAGYLDRQLARPAARAALGPPARGLLSG